MGSEMCIRDRRPFAPHHTCSLQPTESLRSHCHVFPPPLWPASLLFFCLRFILFRLAVHPLPLSPLAQEGVTALHQAATNDYCHISIVEMLLAKGARVDAKDNNVRALRLLLPQGHSLSLVLPCSSVPYRAGTHSAPLRE